MSLPQVADLRAAAPALEFAGAGGCPIQLHPADELEWTRQALSFGWGLALGGVVEYDLREALGGRQISDDEFRALAAASQPLVRIGGEWMLLGDKALRRARQLAQLALHATSLPVLTALGAVLAGRAEVRGFELDVEAGGADDLVGLAEAVRDPALRGPAEPAPVFHGVLRPYQRSGLGWLTGMRRWAWARCLPTTWGSERRCS